MTAKPRRTMLPPHLTRHLYETRRLLAEGEGRQMPPWYRLTPEQRADVEMDMEVFRRAILSAEEEQDLVTAYNASTSGPQETAPPLENCSCPGCSTVAALVELLKCLRRLEDIPRSRAAANVFPFNLSEVTTAGPGRTPEDTARPRTAGSRRSPLGLGRLSFLVVPPPDPQAFLRGL